MNIGPLRLAKRSARLLVCPAVLLGTFSFALRVDADLPQSSVPGAVAGDPSETAFFAQAAWRPVKVDQAYALLTQHLQAAGIDLDKQAEARDVWETWSESNGDLLDRLAASLAATDDRAEELYEFCRGISRPGPLPEFAWLADSQTPLMMRNNLRLYLARWLIQEGYYDEGIAWTDGLRTEEVVAPEALLFYRAIAHQRLVDPDRADADLNQLLARRDELPLRYQQLATLMKRDVAELQDESLDHIARRMEDIRRRLAQGRSGERVQQIENGVIESLDKLIDEIESQMQQQQQAGGASGRQSGGTPMQESQLAPMQAPGQVERRGVGEGSDWGNLPEKDREKALQDIGREFPSHYREVIEEYFRRLAAEDADGESGR